MNKEEEIFLTNIIKATINGEKHLGDKLKERCINYIEGLQQRIDKAKDLSDEIYNFIKCRNSNLFYEIEDLLIKQDKILGGKE